MLALARLRAWAAFRDPNFAHSAHVARLSLQIYDGLESLGLTQDVRLANARFLLEAAALAHDVGIQEGGQKASSRLVSHDTQNFAVSPGLDADSLRCIALIARFHRGALPHVRAKSLFRHHPPKTQGTNLCFAEYCVWQMPLIGGAKGGFAGSP